MNRRQVTGVVKYGCPLADSGIGLYIWSSPAARRPPMNAPTAFPDQQKPVPPYEHTPLFPLGPDTTPYKKITTEGVRVENVLGKEMLGVSRAGRGGLGGAGLGDTNNYLRPGHLKQL